MIVGTRGSSLALAQTRIVMDLLSKTSNEGGVDSTPLSFEVKVIKTEGDDLYRRPDSRMTGKDSFTSAIDSALSKGEIDLAVHSLKDVPAEITLTTNEPKGELEIAALPKRGSPLDALISRAKGVTLEKLPKGARIGTSSVRRALQLKQFRSDLEIVEIHGNVNTRIAKLRGGEFALDAIILAEAGLERLHLEQEIDQILPQEVMIPAVGQGCLAVEVRSDDLVTKNIVKKIDDPNTRACVEAERSFSNVLGGGCNFPIAALASIFGTETLSLEGIIAEGKWAEENSANLRILRERIEGSKNDARLLGERLASKLMKS